MLSLNIQVGLSLLKGIITETALHLQQSALSCAVSLIRSGNNVHLEGIQFGSAQNVDLWQKC